MDDREQLIHWLDQERDAMVSFFQGFVATPSPNPPGDTTAAVSHITDFLERQAAPFRLVAPQPTMANVVGTFDGAGAGRHLVLNGHIDVFPVGEDPAAEGWTRNPWGGEIHDGRIYGRGSADMKCGTSASIWTYVLLHRLKDRLRGRLTLTCVSDEETFGPWGARWLMEHEPEVRGDCCLNGEPSSPLSIRYGEKGLLWLTFTVRTDGAHGAYTHASPSATRLARRPRQPHARTGGGRGGLRSRDGPGRLGDPAQGHAQRRHHPGRPEEQHGAAHLRLRGGHPPAGGGQPRAGADRGGGHRGTTSPRELRGDHLQPALVL
jgi:acetylornithine deacetylase/succinyl-diaminopimelate desuccinylase-like protein